MRRAMEIRAVVGKIDGWEVVTESRCCVFAWQRIGGRGVVYIERHHVHEQCRREIESYARSRGFTVVYRRDAS
jgi:hypothetical protein